MPKSKGSNGDFHNGVPNKHLGNKGDTTNDIRSSSQLKRAQRGELKNLSPDAQAYLEAVEKGEEDETLKSHPEKH